MGKGVFINACCHFQDHGGVTLGDGCQIGHNVVFATLDHGIAPAERRTTVPAPIVLGRNVWVGSNATILRGVTIGDNAVVAAVRSLRKTWRRIPSWEAFPPPAPPYRRVVRNRCSGKAQRKKSSTTCARITRTNIDSG